MKAKMFFGLLSVSAIIVCRAQTPEATTYQIRNVKYGDLLRPRDANSADGTPIVLYSAQPWKCMTWQLKPEAGAAVGGTNAFRVKNLFTSKTFCVDATADAAEQRLTEIHFPKKGDEAAPVWTFVGLGDGNYEILDAQSGKAVTAVKDAGAYEAHVVTAPWKNGDNQKWHLEKIDPKDLTM